MTENQICEWCVMNNVPVEMHNLVIELACNGKYPTGVNPTTLDAVYGWATSACEYYSDAHPRYNYETGEIDD